MASEEKIIESATIEVNNLVLQKKLRKERVYNLSAGEPVYPMAQAVLDTVGLAMRDGRTRYSPILGVEELRIVVSDWMNRIYKSAYTPQNVIVTCGGKFGIYALCQTLLSEGDEALIISPYWVSYPILVRLARARPIIVNTEPENNWQIDLDKLFSAVTSRTKVLIINSAGNPTGVVYTRDEMSAILKFAAERNIKIISDEVYSGLTYDGIEFVSAASFPEYNNNVYVVQSVSKHFAMTGWRVGFVFGDGGIIKKLGDLQSQTTTGTSTISQWAAVSALMNASTIMSTVNSAMRERRDCLVSALRSFFYDKFTTPGSGLYLFVPIEALGVREADSVKFCRQLLDYANIALVPGAPFGRDGYVRFAFGGDKQEIIDAVHALAGYLKKSERL